MNNLIEIYNQEYSRCIRYFEGPPVPVGLVKTHDSRNQIGPGERIKREQDRMNRVQNPKRVKLNYEVPKSVKLNSSASNSSSTPSSKPSSPTSQGVSPAKKVELPSRPSSPTSQGVPPERKVKLPSSPTSQDVPPKPAGQSVVKKASSGFGRVAKTVGKIGAGLGVAGAAIQVYDKLKKSKKEVE
jgi:hypothetical protein